MTGLRERKKERTRREIADAARRLFERQGFSATTVEQICAEAEVSVSTFFRYFRSKEATAFPEAEERVAGVLALIEQAPADEPLHVLMRRVSVAVAEHELNLGEESARSYALLAREPALAAHNQQLQARVAAECTMLVARRLGVDPLGDTRPGIVVGAAFAAVNGVWAVWLQSGMTADLRALVHEAHDLLDAGLASVG